MDDEEEEGFTPTWPWSWKSAFVYVGDFTGECLEAASKMVAGLSFQLAASVNHDIQKRTFREQAARDIESITNNVEE